MTCHPPPPTADDSGEARRTADIHYLGNPHDPPINAVICNAQRLQNLLIRTGALNGHPLPFPALSIPDSNA